MGVGVLSAGDADSPLTGGGIRIQGGSLDEIQANIQGDVRRNAFSPPVGFPAGHGISISYLTHEDRGDGAASQPLYYPRW